MTQFSIIEQLHETHIEQLNQLFKHTWWAKDRTPEQTQTMLKTSNAFGLIENTTQNLIGFSRVLSDEMRYAFIFDVIVEEGFRGKGLGKKLLDHIIQHERFKDVICFELTCAPDMTEFYERFGFTKDYGKTVVPMRYRR